MDAGRCSVFISYKRANGGGRAHHIAADLKHHNIDVYIDTENPEPGRFEGRILNEISRCSHFLVVLNELVVSSFSDENDWVRKEVLYARSQGRTIVPVFDAGFDPRQLAESPLPFLGEYQGIHIHTDCVGDDLIRLRTLITGEERGARNQGIDRNRLTPLIVRRSHGCLTTVSSRLWRPADPYPELQPILPRWRRECARCCR